MMKCFFVLALLTTAACSGASPDDASSQRSAIEGKSDGDLKPTTKDAADGTVPNKDVAASDGCSDALADLQGMLDKAAASGDTELVAGLKNKYALTEQNCNPPSSQAFDCSEALAGLESNIEKALAVGDADAVVGFKEKYVDTLASCGAPTVVSDNGGEKKPTEDSAQPLPDKPVPCNGDSAPLPEKK